MPQATVTLYVPSERVTIMDMLQGGGNSPLRDRLKTRIAPQLEAAGLGSWRDDAAFTSPKDNCAAVSFEVKDPVAACALIEQVTQGTAEHGRYAVYVMDDLDAQEAPIACLEIFYDQSAIPDGFNHPLDFRNAAMAVIETALTEADAGTWSFAESGANARTGMLEVNFGFDVADAERAEKIIRAAVRGTPYACIRDIIHHPATDDI